MSNTYAIKMITAVFFLTSGCEAIKYNTNDLGTIAVDTSGSGILWQITELAQNEELNGDLNYLAKCDSSRKITTIANGRQIEEYFGNCQNVQIPLNTSSYPYTFWVSGHQNYQILYQDYKLEYYEPDDEVLISDPLGIVESNGEYIKYRTTEISIHYNGENGVNWGIPREYDISDMCDKCEVKNPTQSIVIQNAVYHFTATLPKVIDVATQFRVGIDGYLRRINDCKNQVPVGAGKVQCEISEQIVETFDYFHFDAGNTQILQNRITINADVFSLNKPNDPAIEEN